MIDYLKKRTMLVTAVGCCVTAVCGFYFENLLLGLLIIVLIPLTVWLILSKYYKGVIVTLLIGMVSVSCLSTLNSINNNSKLMGTYVTGDFVLTEKNFETAYSRLDCFEVQKSNTLKRGTKIYAWHKSFSAQRGDVVSGSLLLENIEDEYRSSYYSLGVYYKGTFEEIQVTNRKDGVIVFTERVRRYISYSLKKNVSYSSAVTLSALVFGDRSEFSDEYYENVKRAGVAHIMVVSGMHLTILVSLILKLVERHIYNPLLRGVIMLAVVLFLCGACGFTMSVIRAGVTYLIMALGLVLKRQYSGENALGLATAIILMSSPFAIFSVALQLSVLSTFGILAVALPVCNYLSERIKLKPILKWIIESVILSLSACLLTLPVVIYVFGYVSTVSVVANLLVDFPLTVCLCITVIALVLNLFCPFSARPLFLFADYITRIVNKIINYLGSRSYATVTTPEFMTVFAVILIILVFYLLIACKKRIDVLKLKAMNKHIIKTRGRTYKWRSFLKKL